jgi:hypothetical protein
MGLDVSPDAKTIVFDLLGDIYSIPVTGGEAKTLRTGFSYEVQPRFSPDGKKISFTSDAGGGDNIWMMNADGTDAKSTSPLPVHLVPVRCGCITFQVVKVFSLQLKKMHSRMPVSHASLLTDVTSITVRTCIPVDSFNTIKTRTVRYT